jgi:formaldehyde-activating enzyme involved in methanogenesis
MSHKQDHGRTGQASVQRTTEQAIDDLICDRIEQAYAFALTHRSNDDDPMFMLYAMHAAMRTRYSITNTIDINQMRRGEVINSMAKLL